MSFNSFPVCQWPVERLQYREKNRQVCFCLDPLMNRYFFLWYYTKGLFSSGTLSWNLVRFVVWKFHIFGLLATLISPWKRDVTFKDWRGLHPVKSLQLIFENLISRFLGMMLRLVVIGAGIVVLVLVLISSLAAFLLYTLAPLSLAFGIVFLLMAPTFGIVLLAAGIVGVMAAFVGYLFREQDEPETTDMAKLCHRPWFERLLGRLGLEKKELGRELLTDTEAFVDYLTSLGLNREIFEQAVLIERTAALARARKGQFLSWENLHKSTPIGKGWQYAYTPHLDRYSLDLSAFDPTEYRNLVLVGREDELRVATLVLERPAQNSVFLVGDPGIGKKTLVHHLARLIRENFFEGTPLGESRVLIFDVGRAVSDAANRGVDVDGALRELLGEAAYAGNVILVVENIDAYFGSNATSRNLTPVFGEFLSLPNFRLIATAAADRYHALAKMGEGTLKFFETVYVRETSEEETLSVLLEYARSLERKQVIFTLAGLKSIVAQSSRYKWEVPFPERALDLAQEALTYWQGSGTEPFIGPKTVDAFITLKTGVPTGTIGGDEKEKLLKLEQSLHERVIGQDEAVRQVAEAMRKARAGFGDAKRPLGSFIFLGPTGVGKTETVKAFAESYFGSEDQMIRLDMSEYQTSEAVARLIGSEAMGMAGQLTDLVREHPFSILLLDELEKAYPKALDIFLQILDEGYVTDGFGTKVSFRNTIIIATSNAGAALIKDGIEKGTPFTEVREQVMDFIVEQNIYRQEFLNRFDGIVFFEPLKGAELLEVTKLKLESFAARLKKDKNITIDFASGVAEKIVENGYDPEFGARSINRYIEDTIEDKVVNEIIAGSVVSGGTLSVTAEDLQV